MRQALILFSLLVLALPATTVGAPPALSEAERILETYLGEHQQSNAKIVAFDHVERTWTILKWDDRRLERVSGPTEKPEVSLRADEELKAFVINTNPLVYTVDRTATAEAAIDSIANLQKLAAGLGSVAGVTLSLRANTEALRKSVEPFETMADSPEERSAIRGYKISTDPNLVPPAPIPDPLAELRKIYLVHVEALAPVAQALDPQLLRPVITSASALSESLQGAQSDRLLSWLQSIESNVPAAQRPDFSPTLKLEELAAKFNSLEDETNKLAKVRLVCRASSEKLSSMLAAKRAPLLAEGAVAKLDQYRAAARSLEKSLQENDGCPAELISATTDLVSWLLKYPPTATPNPREGILLTELHDNVSAYLEQTQRFSDTLNTARTLAASEEKASATVARIGQFLERRRQLGSIDPAVGVIAIPRSSFQGKKIPWSKKRTDTVEVAVDATLKDKLTLRHPDKASGSFEAQRAFADGLEADFALIDTDLYSPKYEAKDIDGKDGGPTRINETDRETRSGKVAVMGAYRFPFGNGFAFGPQLGVGIDTDTSALFYGVSLRWRFLSIGYGRTRQKVTTLRDQEVGQELPAGVSLRTEDKFETEPYWSLAITIKDLPFFQPPASK